MGMLILKIILSVLAAILLLDVVINLFAGSRASDITNGLCRPLFGLLYPHVTMIVGLFIWIIEIVIIVSGIWVWII